MQSDGQCDIAVIGGGPAGSTAAILLARRGHRVVLLEKAHHPRFHIGESLLPMSLPLFERLGVLEQVHAMGTFKGGADFEADNARGYNVFAFARALGDSPPHAYQVPRAPFDALLFAQARAAGADAREGHEVKAIEQAGPRETRLEIATAAGDRYDLQARYVVDASGRDALLASRRKLRRRNPRHQSAALFGHFRGGERRPGADAGNISVYRFAHGWYWMIPLPDGVMSVGAVCAPAYLKQRQGDPKRFFLDTLKHNPALWRRLDGATLIDDKVHAAGNYSYDATRIGGPGWLLVGDAFAFLDPVFSSGVYLAMDGAERAAELIDVALRQPKREATLLRRYERRQRTGLARFAFFVHRFNGPILRKLFREPRNLWQLEQSIISMLAGDLFDSPRVLRRLRLFKLVYGLTALGDFKAWRADRRLRRAQRRSADTVAE